MKGFSRTTRTTRGTLSSYWGSGLSRRPLPQLTYAEMLVCKNGGCAQKFVSGAKPSALLLAAQVRSSVGS
jgi:hypothetical protein